MTAFFHLIVARVLGFLRPRAHDRELTEELEAHLAMAEEDKVRQGMSRAEARRMARVELGGLTQLREAGREAQGLPWLDTFWPDIKLGLRMLRKSWGLTLVGGLAMAIAIAVGTTVFTAFDLFFWPKPPLEDGARVMAVQTWDSKAGRRVATSMGDVERWRRDLRSLEDIGAFQAVERELGFGDAGAETVSVAEMTASGFDLARVEPLLGRRLVEDDERADANAVLVIGYDEWQSRFSADLTIVGRTVSLDEVVHTVVGVMPEDFEFPVNHQYWIPLRLNRSAEVLPGPFGSVFGRRAPGVALGGAQAEIEAVGLLPRADADEQLEARVMPYTFAFTGDFELGQMRWVIRIVLLLVTLLLVPPCANIAVLVYARTVTRQAEFAARSALGASRGRIVAQLFIEMLVLAGAATGVALLLVRAAVSRADRVVSVEMGGRQPFWLDFAISYRTLLFAGGLAIVAALVAGLVPALKATGGRMQSVLGALGQRGAVKLGVTWTVLVVAQVGLSLAVLPAAIEMGWGTLRQGVLGPGFAAESYLIASLSVSEQTLSDSGDADRRPFDERFSALLDRAVEQLSSDPSVRAMAVAAAAPGREPWTDVEIEGSEHPLQGVAASNHLVRVNRVDEAFFDTLEAPLLTGRAFNASDLEPGQRTVIVSQTFAQQLLPEGEALGHRIRQHQSFAGDDGRTQELPWYEVVGVVADRPGNSERGTIYHALQPGQAHPATLVLHTAAAPVDVADRLRDTALALHPSVRLGEVVPLDEVYRQQSVGNNLGAAALAVVTLSVLLLSLAGMYALMSFAVSQRRREIGIRSALGAQPRRLLAAVLRKAVGQLALGGAVGIGIAVLLDNYVPAEQLGGRGVPGVVPAAALFMIVVGALATQGPVRRALRVEPTETLRDG